MSLSGAYGGYRGPNATQFSSYGELDVAGAVTNHLVWPDGPDLNVPPETGLQMTFVSTSANDDKDAGTGAQSIEIHYLDVNLDQQIEQIFLEGLTPVLTNATDIRFINAMHLETFGATKQTAGIVTATNSGTTYGQIAANKIRNSSSARMVPNNYKLRIVAMYGGGISGTAAARVVVRFFTTVLDAHDYTQDGLMIPFTAVGVQDLSLAISNIPPFTISSGVVIGFQCDTDKAALVSAGFFGELERIS